MLRRFAVIGLVLALGSAPVHAQPKDPAMHGPSKAAAEILAAERTYAARFQEVGVPQGMQEFLDPEDGIALTGGPPVRAKEAFTAFGGAAGAGARLSWTPTEIFVANSGDLGASWGDFVLSDASGALKPVTGRYVTVWRKGKDGLWKALMDVGAPDAPTGEAPPGPAS